MKCFHALNPSKLKEQINGNTMNFTTYINVGFCCQLAFILMLILRTHYKVILKKVWINPVSTGLSAMYSIRPFSSNALRNFVSDEVESLSDDQLFVVSNN